MTQTKMVGSSMLLLVLVDITRAVTTQECMPIAIWDIAMWSSYALLCAAIFAGMLEEKR